MKLNLEALRTRQRPQVRVPSPRPPYWITDGVAHDPTGIRAQPLQVASAMACDNYSLDFGVQSPSINHQWMIAWGKSKRCLSLSSSVNRSSRLVVLRLARVRRSRGALRCSRP
jgi:hypothetical protein